MNTFIWRGTPEQVARHNTCTHVIIAYGRTTISVGQKKKKRYGNFDDKQHHEHEIAFRWLITVRCTIHLSVCIIEANQFFIIYFSRSHQSRLCCEWNKTEEWIRRRRRKNQSIDSIGAACAYFQLSLLIGFVFNWQWLAFEWNLVGGLVSRAPRSPLRHLPCRSCFRIELPFVVCTDTLASTSLPFQSNAFTSPLCPIGYSFRYPWISQNNGRTAIPSSLLTHHRQPSTEKKPHNFRKVCVCFSTLLLHWKDDRARVCAAKGDGLPIPLPQCQAQHISTECVCVHVPALIKSILTANCCSFFLESEMCFFLGRCRKENCSTWIWMFS